MVELFFSIALNERIIYNYLMQAKQMGDYLIVGVHSDHDILVNKGPTVMSEQERFVCYFQELGF